MSEQDATTSEPTTTSPEQQPVATPVTAPEAQPPAEPQATYPVAGYPQQPGYPQATHPQPGYPQAPYAQPGAYAAGGYTYGYAPGPTNNTLAVISLVAGILGLLVIPFVGSVAAVIMGHIGRKQIRERGEGGDGLAIGGLVTGYLGVALWLVLGLFLIIIPLVFVASTGSTTVG